MHALLETIRREDPGRYLTPDESARITADAPHMTARLKAADSAREHEGEILKATIDRVLKKYDFEKRCGYGREKCFRDVGAVYRYAVFSMVCDNMDLLENKLLYWMRTIIHALNFPGGADSILMTYELLRKEARKRIPAEHFQLLDPFLERAETILPKEELV